MVLWSPCMRNMAIIGQVSPNKSQGVQPNSVGLGNFLLFAYSAILWGGVKGRWEFSNGSPVIAHSVLGMLDSNRYRKEPLFAFSLSDLLVNYLGCSLFTHLQLKKLGTGPKNRSWQHFIDIASWQHFIDIAPRSVQYLGCLARILRYALHNPIE